MATTRFYLDMRAARNGQAAPLKLAISHKRETVFILLNVQLLPKQWDKVAGKVINCLLYTSDAADEYITV